MSLLDVNQELLRSGPSRKRYIQSQVGLCLLPSILVCLPAIIGIGTLRLTGLDDIFKNYMLACVYRVLYDSFDHLSF